MMGTINVERVMEDYSRFRGRQLKHEENNALWAWHRCADKEGTWALYEEALRRAWGKPKVSKLLDNTK